MIHEHAGILTRIHTNIRPSPDAISDTEGEFVFSYIICVFPALGDLVRVGLHACSSVEKQLSCWYMTGRGRWGR